MRILVFVEVGSTMPKFTTRSKKVTSKRNRSESPVPRTNKKWRPWKPQDESPADSSSSEGDQSHHCHLNSSMDKHVCLLTSQCAAQYDDDDESQNGRSGNELGTRPSVPSGDLGDDYPTLGHIPKTSFSCAGREPGYYADMETNCQVFRVCTSGSNLNFQSFLCPIGTLFNQAVSVCDWWKNVKCEKSEEFINNNIEKISDLKFGPQLMSDVKKMLTHPLRNSYDESALQDDNVLQEYLQSQEQPFPKNSPATKTQTNEEIFFSATTTRPQHTNSNQRKQYTQLSHNRVNRQYDEIQRTQNSKVTSQQTQSSNFNNNANQHKQSPPIDTSFLKFSDDIDGEVGNEAKQNLVSRNLASASVIRKTLTLNKILEESKSNSQTPKSRITFKTWLVKPSRAAKLTEQAPYAYDKPSNPRTEKILQSHPYVYDRPTTPSFSENVMSVSEPTPYVYNRPTVAAKQITVYQPSIQYLGATASSQTFPPRLVATPSFVTPTKPSRLYLTPTTFKPNAKYYFPPTGETTLLSRQYLIPNGNQQHSQFQSQKLKTVFSSSAPIYTSRDFNFDYPTYSVTKQAQVHASRNNLTFADILTKEKLDFTVNNIVQDTSKVLQTASHHQFGRLQEEIPDEYSDDDRLPNEYLPASSSYQDDNNRVSLPYTSNTTKFAKLITSPSKHLQPPYESQTSYQNTNSISNLPYFVEPTIPTTIERTISIKISIPENVASYLFKNEQDNGFDKLEILNTGSSNYLVLANKFSKSNDFNTIPVGKLIVENNSNISNSQALVFSLLADSLNGAKEYTNIAQSTETTTTQPSTYYQNNIQNADLAKYSKQVSRLTSTQYSENNKNANLGNTATLYQSNSNQHKAKYTSNPSNQNKPNANSKQNYSANNGKGNLFNKQNEIYSGQLYQHPVPDVTNYINNNSKKTKNSETTDLLHSIKNKNSTHKQNSHEHSSTEVEIVQSHSFEPSSAKLEVSPAGETDNPSIKNEEISAQAFKNKYLNAEDGISAQVQDKVTSTIPHPSERNKVVTFKKDNSYFVFKKIEDNDKGEKESSNVPVSQSNIVADQQSAKLTHESKTNNIATYSFVPSVGFEVENEVKGIQNFANNLVDDSGKTNNGYLVNAPDAQQNIQTSDVDVSIDHSTPSKQNVLSALYTGPSSYSAPQSSVGSLNTKRDVTQQNVNYNTRLEQLDDYNHNNGFSKFTPIRQFNF